ncbi:hypothetical protein [Paraburkholderia youngii]|uniref:hypothetical protein n=1 Tax=Paraburkholderia youngii TaxID=2782701 RepID=UPI003D22C340
MSTLDLCLMPTPETVDAFDPGAMVELGQALKANPNQRIITLRISGKPQGLSWSATQSGHHWWLETLVASRLARF